MKLLHFFGLFLMATLSHAHQPVFDMAPRWAGGYGVQIRHESYGSDDLLSGRDNIDNPLGLDRHVSRTWVETVYTFDKSIRLTAKLPHVRQNRRKLLGAVVIPEKGEGWGDLIVGLPLKRYMNEPRATWNVGFTPSLRLPTGSSDGSFPLSDGSLDLGLSVSYSYEGYPFAERLEFLFYQMYDLFVWINREGDRGMREGNVVGLDINWGFKPWFDDDATTGFYLMWDVSARHAGTSSTLTAPLSGSRIHSGPMLVYYRGGTMIRAEWKFPLYERADGIAVSRGNEFNLGIGIAF